MAQPIRRGRWVAWAVCWAAMTALSGVSLLWSRVPPYPDAPLTPIEVVENYNFYERQLSDFDQHASALTPDGSWETVPAVYQNREWRELREEEFGEWSSVRFETNADGTVAAMQLDFSPKGDPYDELFYPQLGVKLCSMAGGGVQKIYMVFFKRTVPAGQVRQ